MELIFFSFLLNCLFRHSADWVRPTYFGEGILLYCLFFYYYSCRNSLHEFWGTRDRMLWTKCFCPHQKAIMLKP